MSIKKLKKLTTGGLYREFFLHYGIKQFNYTVFWKIDLCTFKWI